MAEIPSRSQHEPLHMDGPGSDPDPSPCRDLLVLWRASPYDRVYLRNYRYYHICGRLRCSGNPG